MGNDPSWLTLREKILRQVKDQVRRKLGPEPRDLERYAEAYGKEFFSRWSGSSKTDLLTEIQNADVVCGGDFHAHGQAQRTHLRILRELTTSRPVVIALECFESKDQKWLDQFLSGKISESRFLERVQWESRWGFAWLHYKAILDLARERRFRVIAVNRFYTLRTASTLRRRDQHAAQLIAAEKRRSPESLIYVIFGDLHLARGHLPAAIEKALGSSRSSQRESRREWKIVIVYQNSERIYFQLARKSLESSVNVVRLGRNRFCVMGTPPWIKWQSYLLHLQKESDQDFDDADEMDYTEHIHDLVLMICEELRLRLKLHDFSVYGPGSPQVWVAIQSALNRRELAVAAGWLAGNKSFFVPKGGIVYLAQPTTNHGAAMAGHYLQAKLSERGETLWNMPQDYLAWIWVESLGFLASKIVNHQRKAETQLDLKSQLAKSQDAGREALVLALNFSLDQIRGRDLSRKKGRFRPRRKASYFESARLLGAMLGERLYTAYRRGLISKLNVVEFFSKNVRDDDFAAFYKKVVDRVRMVPSLLNRKDERL